MLYLDPAGKKNEIKNPMVYGCKLFQPLNLSLSAAPSARLPSFRGGKPQYPATASRFSLAEAPGGTLDGHGGV